MTTELFEASERRCSGSVEMKSVDTCTADCRQLNTQDYMDLLWTTLAEFPGLNLCLICVIGIFTFFWKGTVQGLLL